MVQAIYIGRDGQQLGPYSKAQLEAMAASGQILPGDMAWHEGLQGWEAAAAVLARLGIDIAAGAPPPLPPSAVIIPQRAAAGAATASAANAAEHNLAAGLGTRWLASFIDGLILGCVMIVAVLVGGFAWVGNGHDGPGGGLLLFMLLIQLAYFTLLQGGARMASVGKSAMGMIVVGSDGQPIGYLRAALRYIILMVTSYLFPLLLVMLFTQRRQGLHDLLVGSVVVERNSYDPQHWDYDKLQKSPRGGGALLVLAIGLLFGVFFMGILAAIAIPAYQDYTLRSRVMIAMTQADPIKASVTQHYSSSNTPLQYADLGMSGPMTLPGNGGLITVNADGVITITLGTPPLTGQSLRLTPTVSPTGISWICASDDIKKKYLPQACR